MGMGAPPHSGARGNGEQLLTFRSLVVSALPPLPDDTAVSPNEVLAVPVMIADGFGRPVCNDMPMAAPGGAHMEQEEADGSARWHRSAPCLLYRPQRQLAS